jgi:hypothetical protein
MSGSLRLTCWKTLARITPLSALAALPLLGLAVVYQFGLRPAAELERIICYELLMVHAFPFLGAVLVASPKTQFGKIGRWACFVGLLVMYLTTAYAVDGWWGIGAVMGLGLATYCGLLFLRNPTSTPVFQRIGVRWMFALLTMFGVCIVRGIWIQLFGGVVPNMLEDPGFGMLFFLTLGICELVRAYDLVPPKVRRGSKKDKGRRRVEAAG